MKFAIVLTLFVAAGSAQAQGMPGGPMVSVVVPDTLSATEAQGKSVFDGLCAQCHGPNASGREGFGPPLVHQIYEPNHHGDMSFLMAAQNGVRAHHWRFGNMPPVNGATPADIEVVVAYVRRLQKENGIR